MKNKFTPLLYSAAAVMLLTGTSAIAQPGPIEAPDTPGPVDGAEQVDPGFPPEAVEPSAPESEPLPEEPSAPEGEPVPEEAAPIDAAPSISSDGSNSLVTCGPNGAAYVMERVTVGCHVLKVNSPPGQSANAEAE